MQNCSDGQPLLRRNKNAPRSGRVVTVEKRRAARLAV
jgi:hypothetical protein